MHFVALNTTNHLSLRGSITAESADALIHDALTRPSRPEYLYLDTPGGEVLAGQRIIHMVVQLHLACIVMKAYSMGFAILQHCSRRLVLEGATLMQHPISVALERASLASARGHLEMVARLGRGLVAAQARRLNVSSEWFENRTADEWWLDHAEALRWRCADASVAVWCTAQLARKNLTLVERERDRVWPKQRRHTYSACPLVSTPLETVTVPADL